MHVKTPDYTERKLSLLPDKLPGFFVHHHCVLVYTVNLFFFFLICLGTRLSVNYIVCIMLILPVFEIPCFCWHYFLVLYY